MSGLCRVHYYTMFTFEDMMLFGAFLIALLAYLNDKNNKRK